MLHICCITSGKYTAALSFIYNIIIIMAQILILHLGIIVYLIMACCFFNEWLEFFLADEDMDSEQRLFSIVILVIATILWPIVVPFAYLELLKLHKKHKNIIDLLIQRKVGSHDD